MTPPPRQFTGDDPLVDPLNRMLKNQVENRPLDSEDIIWDRTPWGARPKFRKKPESSIKTEFARFQVISEHKSYLKGYKLTKSVPDESKVYRIAKPDNLRVEIFDSASRIIAGYPSESVNGVQCSLLNRREYYTYEANGALVDSSLNPWNRRTVTFTDPAYLDIQGPNGIGQRVFSQSIEPPYSGAADAQTIITAQHWNDPIFSVRETPEPIGHPEIFTDYPLNWMDTNRDSRRWMDDFTEALVCILNTDGTVASQKRVLFRASDYY